MSWGRRADVPELDFFTDTTGRTESLELLEGELGDNTPPLDTEGIGMGGFMDLDRGRIIAIETGIAAEGFQDFR